MKLSRRKTFSLICVLLCAVLLAGCASDTGTGVSSAAGSIEKAQPVSRTSDLSKHTRVIGRGFEAKEKGGMYFSWTCSGIEFSFEGTAAYASLSADESFGADSEVLAGVFVDGEKAHSSTVVLSAQKGEVTLCEDLENGLHTVRLLKLSEAQYGAMLVSEVWVDGNAIEPTDEPELLFEFVGDSVTCGYGTLAKNSSSEFKTSQEDGSVTYAYLAASEFGARADFVCVSGVGVYKNSDGSQEWTMSKTYPLAAPYFENRHNIAPYTAAHRDSQSSADLVVINLGQSDELVISPVEKESFKSAYSALLTQIRAANPDAWIVCTYGSMRYELYDSVSQAVKAYSESSGDEKTLCFSMDYLNSVDHNGTLAGHPSPKAHNTMAKKLIKKLNALDGIGNV